MTENHVIAAEYEHVLPTNTAQFHCGIHNGMIQLLKQDLLLNQLDNSCG